MYNDLKGSEYKKPPCMDCTFFQPFNKEEGHCRFKEPPWVIVKTNDWCGKWVKPGTGIWHEILRINDLLDNE